MCWPGQPFSRFGTRVAHFLNIVMNDPTKGARSGGSTITGGQTGFEGIPHDGRGVNASWPGTWAQGVMFVITLPAEVVRHDLYPNRGGHKAWLVSI